MAKLLTKLQQNNFKAAKEHRRVKDLCLTFFVWNRVRIRLYYRQPFNRKKRTTMFFYKDCVSVRNNVDDVEHYSDKWTIIYPKLAKCV